MVNDRKRKEKSQEKRETPEQQVRQQMETDRRCGISRPAGHYSNSIIRARNGGVKHQFEDSIGGCSANYK
jgi:hypothetical protein